MNDFEQVIESFTKRFFKKRFTSVFYS